MMNRQLVILMKDVKYTDENENILEDIDPAQDYEELVGDGSNGT